MFGEPVIGMGYVTRQTTGRLCCLHLNSHGDGAALPLERVSSSISALLRFLYFSGLFATAYWLIVLLVRKVLAARSANAIVESPERTARIQALEKAWGAEQSDEGHETDDA